MTVVVAERTPLVEALANQGIRPEKFREAHPMHIRCPKCDGGREREDSLVLTIDPGSQGAVWHCHRGSCGWTDNMIIGQRRVVPFSAASRQVRKPLPVPEAQQQRSDRLYDFFAKRGISQDTVDAFGCYLTTRWFAKQGDHEAGNYPALVFPYRYNGEVVNRKYRSPHKQLAQEPDPQHTLFNIDAVTDTGHLVWCEGETDCMAIYESGWRQVVSLKDGAPAKLRDEKDPKRDTDRRYDALCTHADVLKDIEKIYLAGDMDAPGLILREELARRLGRHRCWLVTWPAGCKDAGDVVQQQGVDVVDECIRNAKPYPIEDVQEITGQVLDDYLDRPAPRVMKTGITAVDQMLNLPGDGRIIVITGVPNAGKALALDIPVPTPSGWTTMGEIKVGDFVYAGDGTKTRVVSAWDVMYGRPCYEVEFGDGSKITVDEGHQWYTRCEKARRSAHNTRVKRGDREETRQRGSDQRSKKTYSSVKTTSEIANTLLDRGRPNHSVPVSLPIDGASVWPLSIPPYTLGAWLGDGGSHNSCFYSADEEVVDFIRQDGFEVTKLTAKFGWNIKGVVHLLRNHCLICNKHLPSGCLRASQRDRILLLQGLMDTDGHASKGGEAEFCTIKECLADGVFELVASLGMKPKMRTGRAMLNGRDCGPKWRVCFQPIHDTFRLSRKREAIHITRLGTERRKWRRIIEVRPVPSVPVRCISVEHPDHLFLVGKAMIPTHNSQFVTAVMAHLIKQEDRRFLVFSPEMQPWEEYGVICAQILVGKPARRSRNWIEGDPLMTKEERVRVGNWMNERIRFLSSDAQDNAPTLDWILDRGKESVLRLGVTDLLIDPWNEIEHQRNGMTETDYTGRALQKLRAFALRHGCNVWIIAHPAKMRAASPGEPIQAPGPYDINGSANWANKTDVGITVHTPENATSIILWKARFARWGRKNSTTEVEFESASGRYVSPEVVRMKHGYDAWYAP